MLSLIINLTT